MPALLWKAVELHQQLQAAEAAIDAKAEQEKAPRFCTIVFREVKL